MDDRRRETRKKLMAFTPVYDKGHGAHGALLGYLGNLTLQGALIIGEKPLDLQHQAILDIEFPDELPLVAARRLIIPAHVVRCVPDEDSSHEFQIGFEFTESNPEQTAIIQALLDRYHFRYRSWAK